MYINTNCRIIKNEGSNQQNVIIQVSSKSAVVGKKGVQLTEGSRTAEKGKEKKKEKKVPEVCKGRRIWTNPSLRDV